MVKNKNKNFNSLEQGKSGISLYVLKRKAKKATEKTGMQGQMFCLLGSCDCKFVPEQLVKTHCE